MAVREHKAVLLGGVQVGKTAWVRRQLGTHEGGGAYAATVGIATLSAAATPSSTLSAGRSDGGEI